MITPHPVNLDVKLNTRECTIPPTSDADEKAALMRAKKAEIDFRIFKGYKKDSLWAKIKCLFKEI